MKNKTLLLLLILLSPAAFSENADDEEWEFLIVFPMLWAPSIEGSVSSGPDKVRVDVPFENIWDGLAFGIMGDFYASKGKWLVGVRTNYLYMKDTTETSGLTGPLTGTIISPGHEFTTSMHLSVNDLFFGYEVYPNLEILTGVRHTFSRVELDIRAIDNTGFININGSSLLADEHLFDWLVGLKYNKFFDDQWGVAVSADFNVAGDNDVNRGFNVMGIYRFTEAHNLYFGYRYLNIGNTMDTGGVDIEIDLVEKGPQLGYAYSF
ncbi:hypothetical protein EK599_18825 [Vibrio sp. T187]|uniref:hypothetical protein n=1 Tax=Vibrio TaxID=662 RepID=UPI0010C9BDB9|nr:MULTISPECIES: hypothetical protein [Vibrio]MBW3697738.1 hypothetical protein [Vibrio sp. T187]